VERLMHFATALQHDVVIEIRPARRGAGASDGVGGVERVVDRSLTHHALCTQRARIARRDPGRYA